MTCAIDGCNRLAIRTSTHGTVHALCADHERRTLRNAWYAQAEAGVLRPAVSGGVPHYEPLTTSAAPDPFRPRTGVPPALRWRPQAVRSASA